MKIGWICYAEKTHGNWILPYISRVKSAQQVKPKNVFYVQQHWQMVRTLDKHMIVEQLQKIIYKLTSMFIAI
jgi:hypothetical protein